MATRRCSVSPLLPLLLLLLTFLCLLAVASAHQASVSSSVTLLARLRAKSRARMPKGQGIRIRFIGQLHIHSRRNMLSFEAMLQDLRQSVETVTQQFQNENDDHILNVLLGGEWRFRRGEQVEQLNEENFNTLKKELNSITEKLPNWVIAPGTMFFQLNHENSVGNKHEKAAVVNCLPISYQGNTHAVCKKNECDLLTNKQVWGYQKLEERSTFGTNPVHTIKFHDEPINIGVDICYDAKKLRMLEHLQSSGSLGLNSIDIYLISAEGGKVSFDTIEQAMAPGALAFCVNNFTPFSDQPEEGIELIAKDVDTSSFNSDFKHVSSKNDNGFERRPFYFFAPLPLPFKETEENTN